MEPLAHDVHGLQKAFEALQGVVLGLHGDDDRLAGNQGIEHQQTQQRGTIDDTIVI